MTTNPLVIQTDTYTHIYGWTWERFKGYVNYECMFNQTCERTFPDTYKLTREVPGFNGFTLRVKTYITLHNPDGPISPEA